MFDCNDLSAEWSRKVTWTDKSSQLSPLPDSAVSPSRQILPNSEKPSHRHPRIPGNPQPPEFLRTDSSGSYHRRKRFQLERRSRFAWRKQPEFGWSGGEMTITESVLLLCRKGLVEGPFKATSGRKTATRQNIGSNRANDFGLGRLSETIATRRRGRLLQILPRELTAVTKPRPTKSLSSLRQRATSGNTADLTAPVR